MQRTGYNLTVADSYALSTNVISERTDNDVIDVEARPINKDENTLDLPLFNLGSNVTRSGSLGQNNGAIASQTPYIIISRPTLSMPANYGHYHGYPSNITTGLSSLKGYTEVGNIHLDNIPCNSVEEDMINRLLRGGVIINSWTDNRPSVSTLYVNMSDNNVIGKNLQSLGTIENILLKDKTSVSTPVFLLTGIDSVVGRLNYLYYREFDRYYFVKDIRSVRNGLWEVVCGVDVLETYKPQIANQTATISRQEYNYNLYLNDGTLKAISKPMIQTKVFPVSFNDKEPEYIMVAIGQ